MEIIFRDENVLEKFILLKSNRGFAGQKDLAVFAAVDLDPNQGRQTE
jgi:hypothetical protein